MKTFFVDFSGYCEIEAETAKQAKTEFWRLIQEELPLPQNIYEIETIEEKGRVIALNFCSFCLLTFGRREHGHASAFFHYTTAPAICQ